MELPATKRREEMNEKEQREKVKQNHKAKHKVLKCDTRGFLSSTGWRSKLARWVFCWILAGMGVIIEEPF